MTNAFKNIPMQVRLLFYALVSPNCLPPLLWGPPGTAKTSIMKQLAAHLGWVCEHIIVSDRAPEDIGGTPMVMEDRMMKRYPPDFIVALTDAVAAGSRGLLFVDEVTSAQAPQQAPLMRLFHEGRAGDVSLPLDRVRIAGAANPPDEAANGTELAAALANRCWHIKWPPFPADVFVNYLLTGENVITGLPPADEAFYERRAEMYGRAKAHVGSFLRVRPGLKNEDSSKAEGRDQGQFASDRAWGCVVEALATLYAFEDAEAVLAAVAGIVGEPVAIEFVAWLRDANLPDPEAMLAGTVVFKADPKRMDVTFAVLTALAVAATAKRTPKEFTTRWEKAWAILGDNMEQGKDIVVVAARILVKARPSAGVLKPVVQKLIAELAPVVSEAGLV